MSEIVQNNAAFRQLLDVLNPAQRRAVAHIEGPALVIAGPGTGKTQLLAARIGNILLETDTAAQSILCLTFTDAGAQAMRQRLLQLIGTEGHRVVVHTFHGFCSRVIAENPEYFGWRDFEPLSDLERIEIIRMLLERLSQNHPLRLDKKNAFAFETHLHNLFSLMKKEHWTPELVQKSSAEYLQDLPSREAFIYKKSGKGFKKGDVKQSAIEEEKNKMERLAAAAALFPKFNALMRAQNRYDFDDMILWVLEAFQKNEKLRLNYQERFLYILVDEYQDTNGAQNRLLDLLTDFWESPNIFIVGDDDQSIYEFQGARLKNLRDFYEKYAPDLHLTVLTENYRSAQQILDLASNIIEKNKLRAVQLFNPPIEKKLQAHFPKTAQTELFAYNTPLEEAAAVADEIEHLYKENFPLTEIAVLYREHRQGELLMTLLEKKGIPFETKRPENILQLPLIRQFRRLLDYLREEQRQAFSGEHRLFEIFHFRFWKIPPIELAKFATGLANQHSRWRSSLNDLQFLKSCGIEHPNVFQEVFEKIETWLQIQHEVPIPIFLEKVLNQSGLMAHLLGLPDRIFHLSAFHTFVNFVKKEAQKQPKSYGLPKLLEQLDTLDANQLPIPMQRHIKTGDGVQLLTVHGSKGLEFQRVFVVGCGEEAWEKKRSGNQFKFPLPDNLTFSGTEDEVEALRRLFYVAVTRAKTQLQISFFYKNLEGKEMLPSMFLDETGLPVGIKKIDEATLHDAQTLLLLEPPQPTVSLPESARLDILLQEFTLSPTSFNRYLRCPLAFYYQDILKVPDFSSENAAFGLAMHTALQLYFLQMKKNPQRIFPEEKILVGYFENEMEHQRALFSSEHFRQFLALGSKILPKYREVQLPTWQTNSEMERHISNVALDGVPMTGVIDRFEKLENGKIRVIDYKTGHRKKEKTAPPSENQPDGGDYWRQLHFYKILLDLQNPPVGRVESGVISYLEPDSKTGAFKDEIIEFSVESVAFVKRRIKEIDAQIRQRNFTTGCGQKDCQWCRLHFENEMPPHFENAEALLDD